jgi:uncharacterized protein
MEDRIMLSLLLDFYGVLLTDKQNEILNLYYNEDLSLTEISDIAKTSRQAVYDIVKRCHKQLIKYETKMQLMKKNNETELNKTEIIEKINKLISEVSQSQKEILVDITTSIRERI